MRRQTAVWWARSSSINRFGKYTYEEPVEIKCRWDGSGREYRDDKGQTVFSDATVYVDRIVAIGDMLMEGDLESDTASDPTTEETAYEVKRFDKNPNIKATETLYTAYL
jgi:hypothetical protein